MAGTYVSIVLEGLVGVDPSAKLVATALASFANIKDHGLAYPSVARLVQVTGICERQVRQHLRDLQTDGWITPEGPTHGGRGMSTRYRLNLPKMRANMRKKDGDPPQGLGDDKPGNAPHGKDHTNPAAGRKDTAKEKPGGAAYETLRPTAINPAAHRPRNGSEPVLTGSRAAPIAISAFIPDALKGNRKPIEKDERQRQPENTEEDAPPTPSSLAIPENRPKPRTQAEQIAWVEAQLAAGRKA